MFWSSPVGKVTHAWTVFVDIFQIGQYFNVQRDIFWKLKRAQKIDWVLIMSHWWRAHHSSSCYVATCKLQIQYSHLVLHIFNTFMAISCFLLLWTSMAFFFKCVMVSYLTPDISSKIKADGIAKKPKYWNALLGIIFLFGEQQNYKNQ